MDQALHTGPCLTPRPPAPASRPTKGKSRGDKTLHVQPLKLGPNSKGRVEASSGFKARKAQDIPAGHVVQLLHCSWGMAGGYGARVLLYPRYASAAWNVHARVNAWIFPACPPSPSIALHHNQGCLELQFHLQFYLQFHLQFHLHGDPTKLSPPFCHTVVRKVDGGRVMAINFIASTLGSALGQPSTCKRRNPKPGFRPR